MAHMYIMALGTAPTQYQSILGVLLRAIYNPILVIIQLLVRGGAVPSVAPLRPFKGIGIGPIHPLTHKEPKPQPLNPNPKP